MFLTIDVGNTHIVVGLHSLNHPEKALKTWRIATHPVGTADEFRVKLQTLLQLEGFSLLDPLLETVVASSVVPQATAMLKKAFPGKIEIIDSSWPFSFRILADPPQQVGADRLVNAEAVVKLYGGPAVIIDSGTATTLCALTRGNEYLGGAIMPGLELSVEALAKRASKLFSVELVPPPSSIGGNTEHALQSGVLFGYASMIDGMVERFRTDLKEPMAKVIATGGISNLLQGIAQKIEIHNPDLTTIGIASLYMKVRVQSLQRRNSQ